MGSYVNRNLGADEKVVYEAQVSWASQWFLILLGLLTIGLGPGLGLIFWAIAFINVKTTELVITNKRVIAKFGLISRKTVELKNSKVESVQVDQSIMGRVLNFGSIVVAGAGGPQAPIPNISAPLQFRSKLNEMTEEREPQRAAA
ncbi:PH domain-containing protein [Massilia varians]|uniref:PH domain-containing protein n=1 Tax=Massilia varians TaxID=457921 RepID=UPI002555DFDD|nr:PH domain-containing protein [Massilia varians]MDK6075568.1 PH domain-containing protein [Massilia varians]